MIIKNFFRKTWVRLLCMAFFAPTSSIAQTELRVKYHNDTEQTFTISENGRLYFQQADLIIDEGEGVPVNVELSTIRKITFPASATNIINPDADENIIIYPNPAQNYITIASSSEQSMQVKIYALSGKQLINGEFNVGDQINVSSLPAGLYIMKVNDQTFKLSKQ